ncbi:MAG TPA: tetratricopeptide repeat protein, partial [Vicinamibacterales bacterium]
MKMRMRTWLVSGAAALLMTSVTAVAGEASAAPAPDSKRMERAKGYFADEQWARAIAEFQALADDPREADRDVALFWLAQSEHETGDHLAAIQTLARLERQFPKSPWVRFGRSLRIEIAQRLNRDDVLWAVVAPPPPPAPARPAPMPFAAPPVPPAAAVPPSRAPSPATPRPPATAPQALPAPPPIETTTPRPAAPLAPPAPPARGARPRPGTIWAPVATTSTPAAAAALMPGSEYFLPTPFPPDTDLKIEALSGLLEAHGERVIPLLREIALDGNSPDEGRRAILVLARSHRP